LDRRSNGDNPADFEQHLSCQLPASIRPKSACETPTVTTSARISVPQMAGEVEEGGENPMSALEPRSIPSNGSFATNLPTIEIVIMSQLQVEEGTDANLS
jgi:hypothetical protein